MAQKTIFNQYLVINHHGKEYENDYIYIYIYIYISESHCYKAEIKLIQHCKQLYFNEIN